MNSQPLRAGITGYGLAGRYFHAPFLRSAGFDVVGATTTNPDRISHLKDDFPSAKACATLEELLSLNLDLLVVASANTAHASDAIAGLRSGAAVVVDKPMGRSYAEAQAIVEVARETGSLLTTFFNRRWDSDALTIKKAIGEGVLGNIFRIDSRFERFREDANPSSWRERSTAAEGEATSSISSLISFLLHLIGLDQPKFSIHQFGLFVDSQMMMWCLFFAMHQVWIRICRHLPLLELLVLAFG
jgi:predicted dehydrogenase